MRPVNWDLTTLSQVPETWAAPGQRAAGVQALFFENVSWEGRPTRVFAWMGLPYLREGKTCPGMVLLHGGGGTAFAEWVRLWNRRGYAAIAIDQCGCVPEQPGVQDGAVHARHAHGGPPGWDASFDAADQRVEDQWTYHAVAAAIRAHALLAAQPGVDAKRIGVTGISWGGYLTSVVAGVNTALRCAIPVYGCGYLWDNSVWKDSIFPGKPEGLVRRWLDLWDPSVYLPTANMPMCWVSGTNDFAYPLDSLQKSYLLPPGEKTLCIRVDMPHSHADGWAPAEIGVFADSLLGDGAPLPHLLRHGCDGHTLWAEFESARPLLSAEINFTRALGQWQDRKFNRLPAQLDGNTGRVEAAIPPNTTVCFLNVFDDRGCVVSTPHQVLTWEECFVQLNEAQMHYYRGGSRVKPPLVLAHGFSDMGLCWESLARELENEFDITMPDARGHGLSARVHPGEVKDLAADLAGVMRALGIRSAVVGGHSMGGNVAGQLAARFPDLVRALVLEDPPWFLPEPPGGINVSHMADWVKSLAVKSLAQLIEECRAEHPTWSEIVVQRWCESKKQLDQNFPLTRDAAVYSWMDVVQEIQCPTLLVTADPKLGGIITPETAQKIMELNPRFQIVYIAGVGHHIRFGQEQAYTRAVKTFLASLA